MARTTKPDSVSRRDFLAGCATRGAAPAVATLLAAAAKPARAQAVYSMEWWQKRWDEDDRSRQECRDSISTWDLLTKPRGAIRKCGPQLTVASPRG